MNHQPLLALVIELAKEVDKQDPADFGYLLIDEETAFTIAATSVIETYSNATTESQHLIAMASMTKLVVENMVLNMKLSELLRK